MPTLPDDLNHRVVLTVDLGTGGPKVGFVGLDGSILWSGFAPTDTTRGPGGRATQDADHWWRSIVRLTRAALADGVVDPARVVAIAVTGQWSSTVPADSEGHPVAPCRLWLDTSAAEHSRALVGGPVLGYHPTRMPAWIRRTAGVPSPSGGDPVSHILGFTRDEPAAGGSARWFLEPVDALTMRFSGVASASAASMCGAWLVDVRGDRTAYDPYLLTLAGIDGNRLPPLAEGLRVVGPIRPEVAAELGLPESAVVVGGVPDVHSAHLGSGAVGPGAAHVTISTTSWISCEVAAKKTDPLHSIATVPGLRPGSYLVADNHEAAGASLAWLARTFPGQDYDELCAEAATSPVGSRGVIFTPWLAGMRSPVDDRSARALWHGMSLETSRADLVRALLEGVAVQAAWLLGPVESFVGQRLDPVRIFGGGARSDLWCQIHADAMDRTLERVADPMNAQLRGAAFVAGLALGVLAWSHVAQLVPVDGVFRPQPAAVSVYAAARKALPRLHRATQPVRTPSSGRR